ncbi:hypothetical protein NDU88_011674 [Pleurodeles waltl]|uniref:Uncharacterized protein n=1 Tax=Pleurodeles waltl TaxID=8319 RepID=A0AAV7PZI6_PLEWA|nr:hypothetical protein NDU88_011674 [Pleurodeles waltl]
MLRSTSGCCTESRYRVESQVRGRGVKEKLREQMYPTHTEGGCGCDAQTAEVGSKCGGWQEEMELAKLIRKPPIRCASDWLDVCLVNIKQRQREGLQAAEWMHEWRACAKSGCTSGGRVPRVDAQVESACPEWMHEWRARAQGGCTSGERVPRVDARVESACPE